MSAPTIYKPEGCNNKAMVLTVGENEYFFSYVTCIAFRGTGPDGKYTRVRVANSWGPTTGKHFNKMQCGNFETVTDEDFARIAGGQ